jgi:RNA polymerase sigma factor (sigma-70 family)
MQLYEYLTISKKIISRYGNKRMLRDEDAISHVAYFLMDADQKFKGGDPIGFRGYYGRLGVLDWLTKEKRKVKTVNLVDNDKFDSSLLSNIDSGENVSNNVNLNEILNHIDTLDIRTQEIIKLYYYEDKTLAYIANIYGITKQRVEQVIKNTISKIKDKYR